ncbi:MAG TPA: polysaccharide deacetylase family protein [Chryseosolibacter sp.]
MIPHRVPFFIPLLYPSLVWRMPAGSKSVYLTFDDGPIPGPTEFVLDELRNFGVKATFFCIGDNVRKHPGVFSRIVTEGHTVGNHTFNHLSGWGSDDVHYLDNIEKFENIVADKMVSSRLFRPPYGRIKRSQIKSLRDFRIIMWDVLAFDFSKNLRPETCFRKTRDAVRDGSIIVFHDSLKAERNMVYAFPRLVADLLDQGYSFKTLA